MGFLANITAFRSKQWEAMVSLALLLAVCPPVLAQQTVEVVVQNYRFQPAEVSIKAGDAVIWKNKEKRTSHSVVLPEAQGGESERFFPDENWTHRFETPGNYPYHCGPHPEMVGVVIVTAP
jgi:plastocyanin